MHPITSTLLAGLWLLCAAPGLHAQSKPTVGKLMHVDRAGLTITLSHDAMPELAMGDRSSAFRIEHEHVVHGLAVGDFVHFVADLVDGTLTILTIEKSDDTDIHDH